MKRQKIVYANGCLLGGVLIGFFAGKLDSILGVIIFFIGVCLLKFSSIKVSK